MAFKIANEGKRSIIKGAILKAEGLKAGVPDIFIAYPVGKYHGLFIEFKVAKSKPTEAQMLMMLRFEAQGYLCRIAFSLEEAVDLTSLYLKEAI